jgi:glycosyltransferase involved in cell wall biosynthesis
MRILHVIDQLDPARGGPPQVVIRLGAAQAGLGHDVGILHADAPGREDAITSSMESLPHAESLELHRVNRAGGLGGVTGSHAQRWLGERRDAFDFVHLHSPWNPTPHGAARACRAGGIPYAFCPHGTLDRRVFMHSRLKKRLHLAAISGATFRNASFVHALNRYEADCIRAFGFGSPVRVISNGVQPAEYETIPDASSFREAHPGVGDGPYVVFLGRLHPGKGLALLTEAFGRLAPDHPEARLVLVGPDAGARAGVERAAASSGVADRVVFTGPVYGHDKLAALAGASCYALPSEHEGFSVAICEALACGTPVVISPECHFDEVEEAGAGLVRARDAASIAEGLSAMLGDPEAARGMGARGRSLVFERYTWPAIARRLVGLYREAAAGC